MFKEIKTQVEDVKLIPVVKLEDAKDALPLARTLMESGLPAAEITFRTAAAEESIRNIAKEFPDMLLGAGTVLTVEQAKRAVNAGAKFLVSPGMSGKVIEYALQNSVAVFPGACTPTEIMTALDYGLDVIKFFPAKQYGGLDTIKALAPVFPMLRFMPTGGINAGNVREYLEFPKIIACGGSWMVKDDLIAKGDFDRIGELTREAVTVVNG